MSEALNTTSLTHTLEALGHELLAGLMTCLSLIVAAVVAGVLAYIQNNAKQLAEAIAMRELKTKQVEYHRESNEIKRSTPKSQ